MLVADTPQFRGGNPYFFSENPYRSVSFISASMYRENIHEIHIAMQFATKIATLCNKNRQPAAKNQNLSFTLRDVTVRLGLRLWHKVNRASPKQNLPFFGNFAEKARCVTIKLFGFATHIHKLFFSVICLKSVSHRDTAVSSQKRPKSVLDTDNPYQVACLLVG